MELGVSSQLHTVLAEGFEMRLKPQEVYNEAFLECFLTEIINEKLLSGN